MSSLTLLLWVLMLSSNQKEEMLLCSVAPRISARSLTKPMNGHPGTDPAAHSPASSHLVLPPAIRRAADFLKDLVAIFWINGSNVGLACGAQH